MLSNGNLLSGMGQADKIIQLQLSNETELSINLGELRQFRVAVSFAKELVLKGASVIDVREGSEHTEDRIMDFPQIFRVPLEDLEEYLLEIPKNRAVLFLCRTGRRADFAVEYARKNGFIKAYSIGGIEKWAHLE